MKILDCERTSVQISLPPCAGNDPVVELQRANYTSVPLVRTDDDYSFPDPFPADIPFPARGVWRLSATTGCGCYETYVFVDCPAPRLVGEHTVTANPQVVTCCEPEDAIGFDITNLATPAVDADAYPDATLLVDDSASYALDLGDAAVTGDYTWFDEDGIELAQGTFTAGVTEYHDIDLTCAHYYLTRQP